MARRLSETQYRRTGAVALQRRVMGYPEEWRDGDEWVAVQGEDFDVSPQVFAQDMHNLARRLTSRSLARGEQEGWAARTSTRGLPAGHVAFRLVRVPVTDLPASARVPTRPAADAAPVAERAAALAAEAAIRSHASAEAAAASPFCPNPSGLPHHTKVPGVPGCVVCGPDSVNGQGPDPLDDRDRELRAQAETQQVEWERAEPEWDGQLTPEQEAFHAEVESNTQQLFDALERQEARPAWDQPDADPVADVADYAAVVHDQAVEQQRQASAAATEPPPFAAWLQQQAAPRLEDACPAAGDGEHLLGAGPAGPVPPCALCGAE